MAAHRALVPVPDRGPVRDGVYVRVSAVMGREDERFLSPDLQRQAIDRSRAAAPGPSIVVGEWADIDVSGGSMDRPGLNQALQLARDGGMDRLWVYDLSRWARVTTDGLLELERIEASGCRVMSTAETIDLSTPEGYFGATLMLAVHKLRRDQIGRSWRQVADHRVRAGKFHGSNPPLGYRLTPGTGLIQDDVEGPLIAQAFARYADGWRLWHITQAFNAATGRHTSPTVIRKAFANPVYVGKLRWQGQVLPGRHDPLIDDATWATVATRLDTETRIPSRRLAIAHPLSGLTTCAHCGHHLQLHHDQRGSKDGPVWRLLCRRAREFGDCEGPGMPSAEHVLDAVLAAAPGRIAGLRTDTAEQASRAGARARAKSDSGRLRRELAETQAARGRLAVDLARRIIGDDAFRAADAELDAAQRRLAARLDDITAQATAPPNSVQAEAATQLLAAWPRMTTAEQHRALRTLISGITIRRATRYREPEVARMQVAWL